MRTLRLCPLCERRDRSRFLVVKNGIDIYRCMRCDFIYCTVDTVDYDICEDSYYAAGRDAKPEEISRYDLDNIEGVKRPWSRDKLRAILRLTKPRRLLDVGCSMGFFMDEAQRWGINILGVDVSARLLLCVTPGRS